MRNKKKQLMKRKLQLDLSGKHQSSYNQTSDNNKKSIMLKLRESPLLLLV